MIAQQRQRRGMAFIVTLWIIVAMAAVAVAVSAGARTRRYHAASLRSACTARWIERGALAYVRAALADTDGLAPDEAQLVCDGAVLGDGAFWIVRPSLTDDGQREFGLVDEGGKVDLNRAPAAVLERLPNMTPEVAAAIVDWRDTDETVTDGGAESAYYLREADGYNAKNGPFETPLELRLVAGVDDALLYGEDHNRNGVLDPNEDDGGVTPPADNRDGALDHGLAGLTTSFLRWPAPAQGVVAVNTASRQQVQQALAGVLPEARATELTEQIPRRRPFPSLFHLYYRCGLTPEEFTAVEPVLTVLSEDAFRVNVNAAGSDVLRALPGVEEADAQALLTARQARDATASDTSLAWMLDALDQEALLEAAAAGVTGRSWQYTADIVAVAGDGRSFRRVRYVIDASGDAPRVLHRQDLTHQGWCLDEEILSGLRAGQGVEDVVAAKKEP